MSPFSRRLLAVVATVAVVWFLRASAPVTLPLAVALVLVVLLDPVRAWLAGRVPGAVAVAAAFGLAVAALAAFGWALGEAASSAFDGFREYGPRAQAALDRLGTLPLADAVGGGDLDGAAGGLARSAFGGVWRVAGAVVLVYALLALALAEAPEWRRKLGDRFGRPAAATAADAARRVVGQVQRFVAVQAFTSVLTGVLTGLACWALGVDLAPVWGLLAGVLNFVPTLGSVVGVVPPVAFAALQHGPDWHAPALVVVQLGLGAWLDPRLQGRALRLSPFVVLVAIAFWGWLWGVAGAFVAVPVTAAAVVACAEFDPTRWVADLLTRDAAGDGRDPVPPADRVGPGRQRLG